MSPEKAAALVTIVGIYVFIKIIFMKNCRPF